MINRTVPAGERVGEEEEGENRNHTFVRFKKLMKNENKILHCFVEN